MARRKKRKLTKNPLYSSLTSTSHKGYGGGGGGSKGGGGGGSSAANAISQGIAAAAPAVAVSQGIAAAAPYVPPATSSSSSSTAAPQEAAQEVAKYVSDLLSDGKKKRGIAQNYAKQTEKARERRTRQAQVTQKKLKNLPSLKNTEDSRKRVSAFDGVKMSAAQGLKSVDKALGATKAPKPKKIAKKLTKAVAKSGGGVPEVVPPQYRGAVAKYGKMLKPALKDAGVNMTGPEYLARLIQFESGWSPTAENPSSAYGLGQFIDSTAEDFRSRLGVETQDPSKPKQMIKGAAMHASGKYGYNPLYAGYNPGYSDTDPILSVDVGKTVGNAKPIPKQLKRTARQTLGKKPTQAILRGGKVVKDSKGEDKGPIPMKTLKQNITFTEPRSEIRAEQGAPARTSITGMSPEMQAALVRLSQNTGIPVRINEGYRTAKRANEFPSGTASQHHQGNAADVDNNADYSAEDLAKAGLTNTAVAGEPWHFQPINPGEGGDVSVARTVSIPGTDLAIQLPTPTTSSTGTSTGGTAPTGTSYTPSSTNGPAGYQAPNGMSRSGHNVSRVLAAIEARLTTPLTDVPEISQELIDRILGRR